MVRSLSLSTLSTLLLLQVPCALSWGGLGHRTVAYLAERQFSNSTRDMVSSILGSADISDAAVWADDMKGDPRWDWSKPLHYLGGGSVTPPAVCDVAVCAPAPGGCAIRAIANTTTILANASSNAKELNVEALKFLIHIVGDIHQPLHANNIARGGNLISVCFNGTCNLNLHGVWDDVMPRLWNGMDPFIDNTTSEKQAAKAWATRLHLTSGNSTESKEDCVNPSQNEQCPQQWALESNKLVCETALWRNVSWVGTNDLFHSGYYEHAAPVMEARIRQAGNRLAAWMNALSLSASRPVKQSSEEL